MINFVILFDWTPINQCQVSTPDFISDEGFVSNILCNVFATGEVKKLIILETK